MYVHKALQQILQNCNRPLKSNIHINYPSGQVILNSFVFDFCWSVLHFHVLLSTNVGSREAVQVRVCVCRWTGGALMVRR